MECNNFIVKAINLLILIGNLLKMASVTCNTLQRITKPSKIWRSSSHFWPKFHSEQHGSSPVFVCFPYIHPLEYPYGGKKPGPRIPATLRTMGYPTHKKSSSLLINTVHSPPIHCQRLSFHWHDIIHCDICTSYPDNKHCPPHMVP